MAIRFFDYDDVTDSDVIIKGESFRILLDICFTYSNEFSLVFDETNNRKFVELDAHLTYKVIKTPYDEDLYPVVRQWIKFYKCCAESKQAILSITDDFWALNGALDLQNPEDLTFYRKDRSVFFCSSRHQGHGTFYPRQDEDISRFFETVDFHTKSNTIQILEGQYL